MRSRVCVIGAGVGALVAIDLGRLGLDVTLIARAIVDGYANLVPAVVDSIVDVIPVASVDIGSSNILDPAGAVHTRSWLTRFDERGVLTVYPGKLTFAAIAAHEAVSLLAGSIGLPHLGHGSRPQTTKPHDCAAGACGGL